MRTTRVSTLVAIAIIAVAVGWSGARVFAGMSDSGPDVPQAAPYAMVFLAAVLVGGALLMRRRIRRRRETTPPVSADLAVRLLVLAKASALVGAAVVGAYGGLALYYAGSLSVSAHKSGAVASLVTCAAGFATVVSALWLERECRAPHDDDDDKPDRPGPRHLPPWQ